MERRPDLGRRVLHGLAGGFFVISLMALGFFAGGFLASRVLTPRSAMGWDRLADALGGMMAGSALALILGCLLVFKVVDKWRWLGGLAALTLAALFLLLLRIVPPAEFRPSPAVAPDDVGSISAPDARPPARLGLVSVFR